MQKHIRTDVYIMLFVVLCPCIRDIMHESRRRLPLRLIIPLILNIPFPVSFFPSAHHLILKYTFRNILILFHHVLDMIGGGGNWSKGSRQGFKSTVCDIFFPFSVATL